MLLYKQNVGMYLYKQNERKTSINVYFISAIKENLIEYRKKILESQDINNLFYSLETDNSHFGENFITAAGFEFEPNYFNDELIFLCNGGTIRVQIDPYNSSNSELRKDLIQKYTDGNNNGIPNIYRTRDRKNMYSFLTTEPPLVKGKDYRSYKYRNLINLPPELCALQLLLHERFSKMFDLKLDPSEQLELFSEPHFIDSHKIIDLVNEHECGLISDDINTILKKVHATEKILQKCKKVKE